MMMPHAQSEKKQSAFKRVQLKAEQFQRFNQNQEQFRNILIRRTIDDLREKRKKKLSIHLKKNEFDRSRNGDI